MIQRITYNKQHDTLLHIILRRHYNDINKGRLKG